MLSLVKGSFAKQNQMPEQSNNEPTLREILERIERQNQIWDERFYQLTKDTLGFARNVIVTAAVVAPLLRDSLAIALNILQGK